MSSSDPISVCNWGPSEAQEPVPAVETPILKGTPNTTRATDSSQPTRRDDSQEEHEQHIAKLAQPKKAFPGGPARLNQKKKTVAFGKTVNVSQCIEGKPLKDRQVSLPKSGKTMMRTNNSEENKENGFPVENSTKPTGGIQKTAPQKPVVSNGSDSMSELKDLVLHLTAKMEKIEDKVDGLEHDKMKMVPISSNTFQNETGNRQQIPSGLRLTENERQMLKSLGPMLRNSPDFLQSVADLCGKIQKSIPKEDNVPDRSYNRPRTAQYPSHNRNSVLTEEVYVQRSIQQPHSPNSAPYSTESFNFVKRRSIPHCPDGNIPMSTYEAGNSVSFGTSHVRNRQGLMSTYQPGNSMSYNQSTGNNRGYNQPPRRNLFEEQYDIEENEPYVEHFEDEPYDDSIRGSNMDISNMDLRQQERRGRWKGNNR